MIGTVLGVSTDLLWGKATSQIQAKSDLSAYAIELADQFDSIRNTHRQAQAFRDIILIIEKAKSAGP
jgi:hypothetical protein